MALKSNFPLQSFVFLKPVNIFGKLATLGHRIFAWDSSNLNDENVRVFSVIRAKWAQQPSAQQVPED